MHTWLGFLGGVLLMFVVGWVILLRSGPRF
jgi:hypothetical protein